MCCNIRFDSVELRIALVIWFCFNHGIRPATIADWVLMALEFVRVMCIWVGVVVSFFVFRDCLGFLMGFLPHLIKWNFPLCLLFMVFLACSTCSMYLFYFVRRALVKHCLIQDISYMKVIEVSGQQGHTLRVLSHLTSPSTGMAHCYSSKAECLAWSFFILPFSVIFTTSWNHPHFICSDSTK